MTIEEFNKYPKNMRLGVLVGAEVRTKEEWLQEYINNREGRWESPEDMISELMPTLL